MPQTGQEDPFSVQVFAKWHRHHWLSIFHELSFLALLDRHSNLRVSIAC